MLSRSRGSPLPGQLVPCPAADDHTDRYAEPHRGNPAGRYGIGGPYTRMSRARSWRWETRTPAGTNGYWRRDDGGLVTWETGWFVLPEFQGRGIASRATQLMTELAWADAPDRPIHAYPAVDNGASNSVCRKVGFRLIGAFNFEYPPGHRLRCNDWVLDPPTVS